VKTTSPAALAIGTIAVLGLIVLLAWANGPTYFQTLITSAIR
jgi:ABC-type phosphate transport system auxiliary subunit